MEYCDGLYKSLVTVGVHTRGCTYASSWEQGKAHMGWGQAAPHGSILGSSHQLHWRMDYAQVLSARIWAAFLLLFLNYIGCNSKLLKWMLSNLKMSGVCSFDQCWRSAVNPLLVL